ncbi:MFS transporter [Corynebacterium felinum]|uniref:MFS family permease n=1 Tax=Corynebacterium felinum TaxID=131318 RepID=A0ABU2B6X1_9CORY|nr:MFS transporter [Corynebacterium felinum]MDF5821225.1 MFS transporter [Corynebacterium felinum]MDR7353774.1 MFS family permease [Corynebacterium felinum]WJY95953.1 enterobactin exporter EntS [Corynebacterium felinum]
MRHSSLTKNPFGNATFRRWFSAETALSIGAATSVAVPLLIIHVGGSVSTAGIIASVVAAAELCAVWCCGFWADKYSRFRLLFSVVTVAALSSIGVTIYSALSHNPSLLIVSLLVLISAISFAGAEPVNDAALKSLITPEQFPRATAAAQARSSVLSLVGPSATGLVFSIAPWLPFLLRSLCALVFVGILRTIKDFLQPHAAEHTTGAKYRDALSFLFATPQLRRVLLATPFINFMYFAAVSWPVYFLPFNGYGSEHVGLVVSGFALGGLVGATIAPRLTDRFRSQQLITVGLLWQIVGCVLFMLSSGTLVWMVLSAAVMMVLSPALNAGLFTDVFALTPVNLQGRVMALFMIAGGFAAIAVPATISWLVLHSTPMISGLTMCMSGAVGWLIVAIKLRHSSQIDTSA